MPTNSKRSGFAPILLIILLIVFAVVGVSLYLVLGKSTKPTEEFSINKKTVTIGLLLPSYKVERWKTDRDLIVKRAEELGAYVNVVSADDDADKQLAQAQNFIQQKVDVLIVVPQDAVKSAKIVEAAHAAGIKVIAYDRLIKNTNLDYYISFDNVKVGESEAKSVTDVVSKGNFAYIGGSPDDNNATLVKEGAMKVLQPLIDSGQVTLVVDAPTQSWRTDLAYKTMKEYLTKNKTVDAVVAANDSTALGVIQALSEFGLAGKVPVSGQDASLGACQKIAEGTQTVTVYKPLKSIAVKATEQALALASGQQLDTNSTVNNGTVNVPSFLLDVVPVTKDNLMSTVIKDGFVKYEEVYANVPADKRPVK
jgi:D-xylose transport system substrate-binding protein